MTETKVLAASDGGELQRIEMLDERLQQFKDLGASMLHRHREGKTLSAIAEEFKLSRARVTYLIQRAVKREALGKFAGLSKPLRDLIAKDSLNNAVEASA